MKTLLIVLLLVLAALLGGAYLLPATYAVERSTDIDAPPAAIATWVGDLEKWQEWTAWSPETIPDLQYSFGEHTSGVGAEMSWKEKSGDGRIEITSVDPNGGIEYDLEFDDGKMVSKGSIALQPIDGGGTRVVWRNSGHLDGPAARWFGLMLDRMLGPDFEQGLAGLKQKAEGGRADS